MSLRVIHSILEFHYSPGPLYLLFFYFFSLTTSINSRFTTSDNSKKIIGHVRHTKEVWSAPGPGARQHSSAPTPKGDGTPGARKHRGSTLPTTAKRRLKVESVRAPGPGSTVGRRKITREEGVGFSNPWRRTVGTRRTLAKCLRKVPPAASITQVLNHESQRRRDGFGR